MIRSIRFPIRLKILVTLLLAVTTVVSVIVFTMAGFFHEDKKAYINDLVSMTAMSTAEDCRSLLTGYNDRVRVCARIMADEHMPDREKRAILRDIFAEFPALVALSLYRGTTEVASIFNTRQLEEAGVSKEEIQAFRRDRPLLDAELEEGKALVENGSIENKLPALVLSSTVRSHENSGAYHVSATIRLDELLALSARSRVFEVFVATPGGTLLAHPDAARVAARAEAGLRPEALDLSRKGSLGVTMEYAEDGRDLIAGFADTGFGGVVAGAKIPMSAAYLASRDLLAQLGQVALWLLGGGALAGLVWARLITRPLERLSGATREIAQGRFDVTVDVASRDEIGELAGSFNRMVIGLKQRDQDLETAHSQLIHSEKMAAFGQLGAGIAHEVKNPLAGILGCSQIALKKAEPGTMLHTNLQLIEKETRRCKAIIDNLLKFARQEKAAMEPIEVNSVVEDAVAIVSHQLEMNNVRMETDLAEGLPRIVGNPNQLQQVLMNLFINAQQAMEGTGGQVTVVTRKTPAGPVEIQVRDTGPGIPKEVAEKVFEPFFTTKPSGKGTGLGLSVSFGIVKDHGGEIALETAPGRGTTFTVTLPEFKSPVPNQEREMASV